MHACMYALVLASKPIELLWLQYLIALGIGLITGTIIILIANFAI